LLGITMLQFLLLLLPVAAISGWVAGFRHRNNTHTQSSRPLISHDYFLGLNYLINEEPDKAVDVFIKMLEVNSDTVETHLALGNLFRKRGEVDRAIRVHQILIARPQLEKKQRVQALSELAQDYLRAGVLDRAERLFSELIAMNEDTEASQAYLLNIYQQQKDWKQAITVAKKLDASSMSTAIAYYYCELAELARSNNYADKAHDYVKEALAKDKNCVRASIISGKLAQDAGEYKQAIRSYKKVREQDPDFISEIVTPLAECYNKLNMEGDFIQYLQDCLLEHPRISLVLAMSDYVRRWHGDTAAIDFIAEKIPLCLSLRGVGRLVELYLNTTDPNTKQKLLLLHDFIGKLLENKPIYRCVHCGFAGKQMHWLCPSCKRWSCVKPIHGLEGD
jgi:lipopolysaccharide assembly protein B